MDWMTSALLYPYGELDKQTNWESEAYEEGKLILIFIRVKDGHTASLYIYKIKVFRRKKEKYIFYSIHQRINEIKEHRYYKRCV